MPGIGTTSSPLASNQARATWPGAAPWAGGDVADHVDCREVGVERAVAEPWVRTAHVVFGEVVVRGQTVR